MLRKLEFLTMGQTVIILKTPQFKRVSSMQIHNAISPCVRKLLITCKPAESSSQVNERLNRLLWWPLEAGRITQVFCCICCH